MPDFDVIVVGAGPSGSSAAFHASQRGLRVLVVDRVALPRPKACGDALSPRALAALAAMGVTNVPGMAVRGMRVVQRTRSQHQWEGFDRHPAPSIGRVVPRETLDALLLDRATSAGAHFQVAEARRRMSYDGRVTGVELETRAGTMTVTARNVVGATGSTGVRRFLGLPEPATDRPWGVATRLYLRLQEDFPSELEVHVPLLGEAADRWGYGWIFPIGPRVVNVGVGIAGARLRRLSLGAVLDAFVTARCAADPRLADAERVGDPSSAPIAIGPSEGVRSGFLPVGDLAGVANPFTGEGIALALETGALAARAAVEGDEDAAQHYHRSVTALLPRHGRIEAGLRRIYLQAPLVLHRAGDLALGTDRPAAAAVRRLLWDLRSPQSSSSGERLDDLLSRVHGAVLGAARARPVLHEMLRNLLDEPRLAFGWCTVVAGAAAAASAQRTASDLERNLRILETLNLVRRLHDDLPDPHRSSSAAHWGRTTLTLALSDILTATALGDLHRSAGVAVRRLTEVARVVFAPMPPSAEDGVSVWTTLLGSAFRVGIGEFDDARGRVHAGGDVPTDFAVAFGRGAPAEIRVPTGQPDDVRGRAYQTAMRVLHRFESARAESGAVRTA